MQILLIEDNPGDVRLIQEMLRDGGLNTSTELEQYPRLDQAVSRLQYKNFDLILMDLSLPDHTGADSFETIRSVVPNIPIVILTGTADEDLALRLVHLGAQDYLVKGQVSGRELFRAIRYAVERTRHHEEALEKLRALNELKRVEAKLHVSDEILEKVGSLVLILDATGNITYANPEVERVLGYPAADLLGDGWWRLTRSNYEESRSERDYVVRALRDEIPLRSKPYERSLTNRDGSTRRILWQDNIVGQFMVGVGEDVTDLKRAEERFAKAFFANPLPKVIIKTSDDRVLDANPAFFHACGRERDEVVGLTISELALWTKSDDRQTFLGSVKKDGTAQRAEMTIALMPSSPRVWSVFAESISLSDESCILLVLQDITARKEYESALRESEARFRSAFDQATTGMAMVSLDGQFLRVNRSWSVITGYPAEELLRLNYQSITPSEDISKTADGRERLLAGEVESFQVEKRYIHKNGSVIWVQVSVSLVRDGESRPLYFVTQIQDLTQRKLAEQALEKEARKFQAVFEGSLDGMAIVDDDGRCIDLNAAGSRLFDVSVEQFMARRIAEFPGVDKDFEKIWQVFLAKGQHLDFFAIRRPNCEKQVVEFVACANFLPGHHLVTIRDVTERESLEEQLRQSQKMEAIGNLAGGIAHDFNNLLGIVGGYLELVREHIEGNTTLDSYIGKASIAIERASGLTRQLLAFGRKQVLSPAVVDLNALLQETGRMLGRIIGEDIKLTIIPGASLGLVKVDPVQFEQVILNLAVNARDAMAEGGRLVIETDNVEIGEDSAESHSSVPAGSYVVVTVKDTGCGMDAETRERVFEPFFTTKDVGKGTGLGLSTIYGIVKQSGGHVSVESEQDLGTTFRVYFPRVTQQGSPIETDGEVRGNLRGTETILLVEDEDDLREAITVYLKNAGYKVLSARTGPDALTLSSGFTEDIDLLITDVVMPKMNGRELAEQLIAKRPRTRVVFISGYTDDAVVRRGILTSRVRFLQKPFNLRTLGTKIRDAIASTEPLFISRSTAN